MNLLKVTSISIFLGTTFPLLIENDKNKDSKLNLFINRTKVNIDYPYQIEKLQKQILYSSVGIISGIIIGSLF